MAQILKNISTDFDSKYKRYKDKDYIEIDLFGDPAQNATKNSQVPPKTFSSHITSTNIYTVPPFTIPESSAPGAKAKLTNSFSKILTFIKRLQYFRTKKACTIIPISIKSSSLAEIWGSEMNISNAIKRMKNIGLIEIEDDSYQYNAFYTSDNHCKTYRYYYENELLFIDYCEKHDIRPYKSSNEIIQASKVNFSLPADFDRSRVLFSSNLHLDKPCDISKVVFEKLLTLCLYDNYQMLKSYISLANQINEDYYNDYPEFRIRFRPHFTWNKDGTAVVKIGIRATNEMCAISKKARDSILKSYGLNLEKDVSSSVPRVALSLTRGYWIEESVDIYESIYRNIYPKGKYSDSDRAAIKKLFMSIYFDYGTPEVMNNHLWLHINKKSTIEKDKAFAFFNKVRKATFKTMERNSYGSEIFYYESCLYLFVLYKLLSEGHMTWLVYDCFYSKGDERQEDFERFVTEQIKLSFTLFHMPFAFKHFTSKDKNGRYLKKVSTGNL